LLTENVKFVYTIEAPNGSSLKTFAVRSFVNLGCL